MSFRDKIKTIMRESAYKPLTFPELCQVLEIKERRKIKRLQALLEEMEREGEIVQTRYKRYGLPEKMNLIVGTLQGHPRGFGFLIPDDRRQEDIYIPAESLNGALNGDRVIARLQQKSGEKREGEIIRILNRANELLVGRFEASKNFAFVVPDEARISQDVFIPRGAAGGAANGEKVVVKITRWPEKRRNPEGEVVEVLGQESAPGVEVLSLIKKYGLPEAFPDKAEAELKTLPAGVLPEDLEGREDLRSLLTVTIDGEDAKDLDDAVSLERTKNGNYLLGVHIADVAHYVKEGSALDLEALERGTSIYLADRVIPMFPPRLSNDLCSLNPHVDRLTQSVMMEIDETGRVVNYKLCLSVIKIRERLTYTVVRSLLAKEDEELTRRYAHLLPLLQEMSNLRKILKQKRKEKGALDFNFPEVKVVLDEKGKPLEIKKLVRSAAEEIIEEFMLACNETVSAHFRALKVPFLYRVHERPADDKMKAFRDFIYNLGYRLEGQPEKAKSLALQAILAQAEGKPEEKVINTFLLRAMQQAFYSEKNLGHFGLAVVDYSHFTSPIRRYPDLVIHRIMKDYLLKGNIDKKRVQKLNRKLPDLALHCSLRERRAMEAERESVDYKKIQFMEDKTGEEFQGVISGVTSFGFFVELDNTVEGLVHISSLADDYYLFNEEKLLLKGERRGKVFTIGDTVKVRLTRASKENLQVDFTLIPE